MPQMSGTTLDSSASVSRSSMMLDPLLVTSSRYSPSRGWYTYRTDSVSMKVCSFFVSDDISLGNAARRPSTRTRDMSTYWRVSSAAQHSNVNGVGTSVHAAAHGARRHRRGEARGVRSCVARQRGRSNRDVGPGPGASVAHASRQRGAVDATGAAHWQAAGAQHCIHSRWHRAHGRHVHSPFPPFVHTAAERTTMVAAAAPPLLLRHTQTRRSAPLPRCVF